MQSLLKYWKKKLELNDWQIVLQDDCFMSEFTEQGRQGECEWDNVNKSAIIRLLSDQEYGKRIAPYIKEQVLIHELLHIKFGVLWESNTELQNIILHQHIESLAKTLYEGHKQCKQ